MKIFVQLSLLVAVAILAGCWGSGNGGPAPLILIAFTSQRDGNAEVYVMNADDTRAATTALRAKIGLPGNRDRILRPARIVRRADTRRPTPGARLPTSPAPSPSGIEATRTKGSTPGPGRGDERRGLSPRSRDHFTGRRFQPGLR